MRKLWKSAETLALGLALGLTVTGHAAADEGDARAGFVSYFSFDSDQVNGDLVQPTGSVLTARTRGPRESLVRARTDFVEALCRSVEAL